MKRLLILPIAGLLLMAAQKSSVPGVAAYVGKYPFDKVRGMTFLRHPRVRAAVLTHAPKPVQPWVFGNVTASPIGQRGGQILSGACEPHNCGSHNWTVVIGAGQKAAICHFDAEQAGRAQWFMHQKLVIETDDVCPSAEGMLPPLIASRLQG